MQGHINPSEPINHINSPTLIQIAIKTHLHCGRVKFYSHFLPVLISTCNHLTGDTTTGPCTRCSLAKGGSLAKQWVAIVGRVEF
jgi:hypothetical protein